MTKNQIVVIARGMGAICIVGCALRLPSHMGADTIPPGSNGSGGPLAKAEAELAANGNSSAMLSIGMMYAVGQFTERNDGEAVAWLRKAAAHREPLAEHYLGVAYLSGRGVPQLDTAAAYWFERASEDGLATSALNLGVMYASGRGVLKDASRARSLFLRAQQLGDEGVRADAAANLNLLDQNP